MRMKQDDRVADAANPQLDRHGKAQQVKTT